MIAVRVDLVVNGYLHSPFGRPSNLVPGVRWHARCDDHPPGEPLPSPDCPCGIHAVTGKVGLDHLLSLPGSNFPRAVSVVDSDGGVVVERPTGTIWKDPPGTVAMRWARRLVTWTTDQEVAAELRRTYRFGIELVDSLDDVTGHELWDRMGR